VAFLGDGFMVAFPSARGAVACAIGILRDFDEHNLANPDRTILVRIGLNTGEVVRESGTLYGAAVNAAARIMARARGGQILVSQVVKDLIGAAPEFRFVDRGLNDLKGFPTRWRLFEVPWQESAGVPPIDELAAAARRAQTPAPAEPAATALTGLAETLPRPAASPLVGRVQERIAIEQELGISLGGAVRVVSVVGEAGIGKTRLLAAVTDAARRRSFGVVRAAAFPGDRLGAAAVVARLVAVTHLLGEDLATRAGRLERPRATVPQDPSPARCGRPCSAAWPRPTCSPAA
jgi:Adenylate and Guanylate cyclase catalytic domain